MLGMTTVITIVTNNDLLPMVISSLDPPRPTDTPPSSSKSEERNKKTYKWEYNQYMSIYKIFGYLREQRVKR